MRRGAPLAPESARPDSATRLKPGALRYATWSFRRPSGSLVACGNATTRQGRQSNQWRASDGSGATDATRAIRVMVTGYASSRSRRRARWDSGWAWICGITRHAVGRTRNCGGWLRSRTAYLGKGVNQGAS